VDIVAYLRMLRRHWKIIMAAIAIGAVLGAASTIATKHTSPRERTYYKATHTLFLDTSSISDSFRPIYTNLDQIAVLATTGDIPKAVAAQLGGDPTEWVSRIFTVTNGSTNTLDITCAEPTGDEAVKCADTFATQLISGLEQREQTRFNSERDDTIRRLDQIQGQINSLDAQIAAKPDNLDLLQAQRNSLVNQYRLSYEKFQQLADQGGPTSVVSTLQSAEAQPITQSEYDYRISAGKLGQNRLRADSVQPDAALGGTSSSSTARFSGPVSRGILGGLLGMMIGIGLAVVADRVDRRLRTREEVEAAYGLAVLAEVPKLTAAQQRQHAILSLSAPLSRTAEAYRAVRSSLMFQRATDTHHRSDEAVVVLVASAGPKEGKTTTSANLAIMFAETGQRVLAVNCDFRRPALHQFFELPNEPRRVFETNTPGLWVVTDVTSGPSGANPAFVVEEQRRLVASARKRFDVIILDTAPMLTTNDATEVMSSADIVVIVSRAGVTTSDGAQRVRELLSRIEAPVSGVVLLGSEASPNEYYYYYSRSRAEQLANVAPSTDPDAARVEGLFGPEPATEVSDPSTLASDTERAAFDSATSDPETSGPETSDPETSDPEASDPDPARRAPTPEPRPPA
jgi:capsular exopolysaccharide synthesis family protein